MSNNKNQRNTADVDESFPPPAYQESPPFNPNYANQQSSSSNTFQTPPFNPSYAAVAARSPPHTPDNKPQQEQQPHQQGTRSLYPEIPVSTTSASPSPPAKYHPQQVTSLPQPMPQPQPVRYQTIEIPYPENTIVNQRRRRGLLNERRKFPLAAFFFLFGWFCPPLWVIGACCCAGSRNEFEAFWGKVNFIMAIALIVTSIIYSIFAMTQFTS